MNTFVLVDQSVDVVVHAHSRKRKKQIEISPCLDSLIQKIGSIEIDIYLFASGQLQEGLEMTFSSISVYLVALLHTNSSAD